MHYNLVTLFPEWFNSPLQTGLMGKAVADALVSFSFHNPRDFAPPPHCRVDDSPYGGGPGMVLKVDPLAACLRSLSPANSLASPALLDSAPLASASHLPGRILAMTPGGRPFTQAMARSLALEPSITLISGRYEGFDERLFQIFPQIECVSVGDAILNGGEVAALAIIEATARLLPGFMGKEASAEEESFSHSLLEYPHYTRPENFEGLCVPPILQEGNHARIAAWRKEESLRRTLANRPDLLVNAQLSAADRALLASEKPCRLGRNLSIALVHHPVILSEKIIGTSSLTNLDIHDISRSSRTYGLFSVGIITPLEDQLALAESLKTHWVSGVHTGKADRAEALSLLAPHKCLEEYVAFVERQTGSKPLLLASSAKAFVDKKGREQKPCTPYPVVRQLLANRHAILLLGTAKGLAPDVLAMCDILLPPIRFAGDFNHLSVRSAAAIMLDRLLGDYDA